MILEVILEVKLVLLEVILEEILDVILEVILGDIRGDIRADIVYVPGVGVVVLWMEEVHQDRDIDIQHPASSSSSVKQ